MGKTRRVINRETVQQTARLSGLELSEERADELVPQIKGLIDGVVFLRDLVEETPTEPALTFNARERHGHSD